MELQIEVIVVKNSDREREMCRGRGWGMDLRGGFGVRKIGGGGLLRQWRRRSGERRGWRERERWKASEWTGC